MEPVPVLGEVYAAAGVHPRIKHVDLDHCAADHAARGLLDRAVRPGHELGRRRQISESADLVQQITDQSTEEGVKQAHDLSAAKTQVASLTTKLAEAAARADAAEELVAMAKAEAAEARRAAAAASPGKEALQETAEEKSSAAAAEAAATAAAVEAAREEVKGAMGAEREAAIAALREELEVSTRNMSGIGLLNKTSQPNS